MTKYGLLIGINYKGKKNSLRGCINDINDIKILIKSWGFEEKNIIMMKEDSKDKALIPNAFNINMQFNQFCSKLVSGDKAVIYYSGHGTLSKGKNNQRCPSLVPLDFEKVGTIKDETIKFYLYKIPEGVNVFCGFDACNSGTVCDLKYKFYDTSYKKDCTKRLKNFNPDDWVKRQILDDKETYKETNANIITISGCGDEQYSYEVGKNGALTSAILKIIKAYGNKLPLSSFIQNIRGIIFTWRLKQSPSLMIGKGINVETPFIDFL
jgi:hypothetical protein